MGYEKVCVICGKEFIGAKETTKACSPSCGAKLASLNLSERHCKGCGVKFAGKKRQLFCDRRCRDNYYNRTKEGRHTKTCAYCGEEFKTNEKYQKYCGNSCSSKGAAHHSERIEKQREQGLAIFLQKFQEVYGCNFEYISGFINCESRIKLRCKKCSDVTEVNAQFLRRDRKISCSNCAKIEREAYKEKKNRESEEEKIKREELCIKKQIEREESRRRKKEELQRVKRVCPSCFREFAPERKRQAYCSNTCKKREQNRSKEIRRRHKLKENGKIDYSITLSAVIEKHKKICAICGEKVDMSVHSNHDDYPSIDHIIPVSKGGTHTWDNVQLAHRRCNNKKRDMLPEEATG